MGSDPFFKIDSAAIRELTAAGVAAGLDRSKVEAKGYKGITKGKSNPRRVLCKPKALRLNLSGIPHK